MGDWKYNWKSELKLDWVWLKFLVKFNALLLAIGTPLCILLWLFYGD